MAFAKFLGLYERFCKSLKRNVIRHLKMPNIKIWKLFSVFGIFFL